MIRDAMFDEMGDRRLFADAMDWGFEYLQESPDRNVFPARTAIDDLSAFDEDLPDHPTEAAAVLELLKERGAPATVAQVGGRYFGFVNGGVVPAGLVARLYSDFWDQNSALEVMSPLAAKLETVVEKWLVDFLGLPETTVAGFVSGSSMATFCGLAAARHRVYKRTGWDVNERGLSGAPKIRVVAGRAAHSTVLKAIGLLGLGTGNVEWVETDEQGRMRADLIPPLDTRTILILQAGNVNSGAFDDFTAICETANDAGAWVHVDGAFGLWAAGVHGLEHLTTGMNLATSWSVDGHKTLNTPYDNGIILCSDPEALAAALGMSGSYIVRSERRDGLLYTPEMSRRARIIELWATMKALGRVGIGQMVHGLHERAMQFAEGLRAIGIEVLNDIVFNQVLAFYRDSESTRKLLDEVQEQRVCWCGGSKWAGKDVIRISVCSWATTEDDVRKSIESFAAAKGKVGS